MSRLPFAPFLHYSRDIALGTEKIRKKYNQGGYFWYLSKNDENRFYKDQKMTEKIQELVKNNKNWPKLGHQMARLIISYELITSYGFLKKIS